MKLRTAGGRRPTKRRMPSAKQKSASRINIKKATAARVKKAPSRKAFARLYGTPGLGMKTTRQMNRFDRLDAAGRSRYYAAFDIKMK